MITKPTAKSLLGLFSVGDRKLAQLPDDQQVPIGLVALQRLAAGPLVIQELGHLHPHIKLPCGLTQIQNNSCLPQKNKKLSLAPNSHDALWQA